ncbi:hypothetical protein QE152_g39367 [Popillia japonica]|uniref:Uncharacterized protein n=1 Tax=Popillia japonica TaxID=7064 RepID=A0AAW1HTQ4_POPJA
MATLTCKNCQTLENIIGRKINWFNLLSAENISLHHSLAVNREQIRYLQEKISNSQRSSYSDQQEIVRLYIETEYLKCQLNKNTKHNHESDSNELSPLVDYQKKIQNEHLLLIESETELWKKQNRKNIQKLEEHIKVLLDELEICHKELANQSKYYLHERQSFRESINDAKLKSEVQLNSALKENMDAANQKMQLKFDALLKYKDEQIKRQDELIAVLKKQQEAVINQFHRVRQNKHKDTLLYKEENLKLKAELDKLRLKYEKLEERRLLEVEGYRTQIKFLYQDKDGKK